VSEEGVRLSIVRPDDIPVAPREPVSLASLAACEVPAVAPAAAPVAPPTVSALSYSSLGEYRRCGYRFYVERVLGLPPVKRRGWAGAGASAGLGAAERGVLVHALLERLDFRRPIDPSDDMIAWACAREGLEVPGQAQAEEIRALVRAFAQSETCARLGRATGVRREERFRFLLAGVLVTGALDVLAREPDRMLVVDYKSDHLESLAPAEIVASQYLVQRLVYALALLRAGAERVEVVHVFLERPDEPVSAAFSLEDVPRLEAELSGLAAGVLRGEYVVTDTPHREVCDGCPAEGGLCSWPLEMTRREAADRLF
jgi:hypothetical protein